jgi:hypothetical protein
MDGYLVKPVRQAELMALAEGLTAGRRAAQDERTRAKRGAPAAPAGGEVTASETVAVRSPAAPEKSTSDFPEGGPIDWKAVLRGVGGDVALLERVVDATLEEGPALLDELRRLASKGCAADVHRAAHKLEGTLRTVHDDGLIASAEEIEVRAQRGEIEGLAERVEDLGRRLEPVLDAFREWRSGGRNLS